MKRKQNVRAATAGTSRRNKRLRIGGLILLTLAVVGLVVGAMWAFGQKDRPIDIGVAGETSKLTLKVTDVSFQKTFGDLSGPALGNIYAVVDVTITPKGDRKIALSDFKIDGEKALGGDPAFDGGKLALKNGRTTSVRLAFEVARNSSRNLVLRAYGFSVNLGSSMSSGGSLG